MSNFFDSEIVKEELQEIRDLQNEIYGKIPTLNMFSHDEKVDHIEKLEILLEKPHARNSFFDGISRRN